MSSGRFAGPPQGVRTLVAVAHFDMVGYSRLISRDDAGTMRRLRALRAALIDPLLQRHGGFLFQTGGDSLLVIFESILEAVRCAQAFQYHLPTFDDEPELDWKFRFRIGIEMGDVIADGTDLHGEGVIVAVRLQTACPPGAVCISRAVHEHVRGKIEVPATSTGALQLKNISRPVEAFVLDCSAAAPSPLPPTVVAPEVAPTERPDSVATQAPFGDLPAIAVLPLRSHGGEMALVHLAEGLTDDLIGALSRWRMFPVIARNSVFAYRGQDRDARDLGRELGARYLVGGSVRRRTGGRIRVSVELIDAETADQLLTEQFDYSGDDPDALEDEIVRAIAAILAPEVLKQENARAARRPRADATVHDLIHRGNWHRNRQTREEVEQAKACFEAALAIDPNSARALADLSMCLNYMALRVWTDDTAALFAESLALARRAVAADQRAPYARFALGIGALNVGRRDEAAEELRETIRLNPSHAYARANLAHLHNYANRPDAALPELDLALRLNPHDPNRYMWLPYIAASHYLAGRYKACLAASEQALAADPEYPHAVRYLVAALGQLGLTRQAASLLPRLRQIDKTPRQLEALTRLLFVREAADHIIAGFHKAGFREEA